MKIAESILDLVGNTPLIRMPHLTKDLSCDLLFKLEYFNPLQSVKDRIALNMIEKAEKSGELKPGMQVIEPTSGNTGIGLAFVCAAKGYPITLVMPETMSTERRTLLLMLGAHLVLTPGPMGMKGAIAKANELVSQSKNAYLPRQFENPNNPNIHETTTAVEIWKDTGGKVDIVIAGVGTGGTITGVGRVLKKNKPSVKMIAVEPTESPVLSGGKGAPHKIQGIGAGFVPKNYEGDLVDQVMQISSAEALEMAKKVIKTEGVPIGISSGAAIAAALKFAQTPEAKGKTVVVICASATERYLSTLLAEEARNAALALPTATITEEQLAKFAEGPSH